MKTGNSALSRPGSSSGTSKSEHSIQTEILLAFGALPWLRIWRQNTGKAYGYGTIAGALAHMKSGRWDLAMNQIKHAQLITFGTPGQADIQGILGHHIEPEGRFLAIEVKRPGETQTDDQVAWQAMVEAKGGLYILAYSLQDVRVALRREGYPA